MRRSRALNEIGCIALCLRRDAPSQQRQMHSEIGGAASCLRHDAAPHIYVNKWRARRARYFITFISDELLKGGWGEVLGGFGVNS